MHHHRTVPDPDDTTWHFAFSEEDPTCLKQVLGPDEDVYGILAATRVRPPATYCGYRYDVAPGPPARAVRTPVPGHAAVCGLARCWRDLSDYWMGSRSKTADRLFSEYLDLRRCAEWGQPAQALRLVSRGRVRELAKLQRRRGRTVPEGLEDTAPRVSARALAHYDALVEAVSSSA